MSLRQLEPTRFLRLQLHKEVYLARIVEEIALHEPLMMIGETSTVRDCIHYAYGEDRLEERDVYQVFSCGHCGASGEVLIRTEERWVCHGSRG